MPRPRSRWLARPGRRPTWSAASAVPLRGSDVEEGAARPIAPGRLHSPPVDEEGGVAHDRLHGIGVLRIVVAADPPLTVHEHEVGPVEHTVPALMLRRAPHTDSQPTHHGVMNLVGRYGEEGPHPRAGAVFPCVDSEPGGIVELGVHADRDEVKSGLEVSRSPLDPRHLPGDCRADRVAPCEDEARHPHAPREILRTEGAAILRGELEWRQGSEDLQPRWQGRAERPHDRPGGDERDEERPGDRARHYGAHCALEAIAKGRWACGGHATRIVAAGGEA